MVTTIRTIKTPPENKNRELTLILDELSHDPDIKLDQIKSMIVVCVAFKMYPGHIVNKSIKHLRPYKRQQGIKFVSTVLYCKNNSSNVYVVFTYD